MPPPTYSDLNAYIFQLMTTHAPMFVEMGNRMYSSFVAIVLCWFGLRCALKGHFDVERLVRLVLTISFGFAMIRFYSIPIPVIGRSFFHIIFDQGIYLSNQLNNQMVSQVSTRLNELYMGLETPGISALVNVVEAVRWAVTILILVVAQAAVFMVIALGYIAAAICAMTGPIFIPWFIVPEMTWLFWGWLRAFMQYSFYGVVANAYLFVFGNLLINFVDRAGTDFSGLKLAVLFYPLLFILIGFTWGVLKIPSINSSLFSGRSGEFSIPGF